MRKFHFLSYPDVGIQSLTSSYDPKVKLSCAFMGVWVGEEYAWGVAVAPTQLRHCVIIYL